MLSASHHNFVFIDLMIRIIYTISSLSDLIQLILFRGFQLHEQRDETWSRRTHIQWRGAVESLYVI